MKNLKYIVLIVSMFFPIHQMYSAEQPVAKVNLGDLSVLPKEIIFEILRKTINWNAKSVQEALLPAAGLFQANKYANSLKDEFLKQPDIKALKDKLDLLWVEAKMQAYANTFMANFRAGDPGLVQYRGYNGLQVASVNNDTAFLEQVLPVLFRLNKLDLINQKFGPDSDLIVPGLTLLHTSAFGDENNIKTVQLLLQNGADANIKDESSNTPLIYALQNKHFNTAKELLKHTSCENIKEAYEKLKKQQPDLLQFIRANSTCGANFLK